MSQPAVITPAPSPTSLLALEERIAVLSAKFGSIRAEVDAVRPSPSRWTKHRPESPQCIRRSAHAVAGACSSSRPSSAGRSPGIARRRPSSPSGSTAHDTLSIVWPKCCLSHGLVLDRRRAGTPSHSLCIGKHKSIFIAADQDLEPNASSWQSFCRMDRAARSQSSPMTPRPATQSP